VAVSARFYSEVFRRVGEGQDGDRGVFVVSVSAREVGIRLTNGVVLFP